MDNLISEGPFVRLSVCLSVCLTAPADFQLLRPCLFRHGTQTDAEPLILPFLLPDEVGALKPQRSEAHGACNWHVAFYERFAALIEALIPRAPTLLGCGDLVLLCQIHVMYYSKLSLVSMAQMRTC